MRRYRLTGGILLVVAAVFAFFGLEPDASLPIAAGLLVVGIALIASGRRRTQ